MRGALQTERLGTLCDMALGKTPARDNSNYWDKARASHNVWLSIADLLGAVDKQVSDSKEYLSDEGAAVCKLVKAGTLLLSFKLTIGRLAFAGRDLYTNEAIAALTIRDERRLSKEYLYWYLQFFDWDKAAEGEDKLKGKTLNKEKLGVLEVHFPSLPEQRRIVALLDDAFEGISTATANAEKNLQNARAVFESEREDALAFRPGWSEGPLGDLCDIKHGFAFKGEFFTDSGQFVLLTPGSFFEHGGYRDRGDKQKYYVGEIPDGYLMKKGEMLVAMTEQAAGLLGSPLIVPESWKFLHNQRLGLVVPREGRAWVTEFFFHVFNLARVRKEIHDGGTGQKVRHTSPGRICAVRIAYPDSLVEQRAVAGRLAEVQDASDRLEAIYQQKLDALDELKKSLLHHAFSGAL